MKINIDNIIIEFFIGMNNCNLRIMKNIVLFMLKKKKICGKYLYFSKNAR